jgi:hypothetical protein
VNEDYQRQIRELEDKLQKKTGLMREFEQDLERERELKHELEK